VVATWSLTNQDTLSTPALTLANSKTYANLFTHLFIGSTRDRHGPLRRLVSHGFSERALREQEPLIQSYCDLLMKRLYEHSKGGTEMVDMVQWYNVSQTPGTNVFNPSLSVSLTTSLSVLYLRCDRRSHFWRIFWVSHYRWLPSMGRRNLRQRQVSQLSERCRLLSSA
jgi:hypothetical protein